MMIKKKNKSRKKVSAKDPTFEEALSRLEEIVSSLESGKTSLEDSLRLFEEGIKLSRLCHVKLKEAQRKVEILLKSSEGEFVPEAFQVSDESD